MKNVTLEPAGRFQGQIEVPGDKSLSHRAQLFAALAEGESEIAGLSMGEDVTSTRRCLESLGVAFDRDREVWRVKGVGLRGLKAPSTDLDCGNSGSTIRMLSGVLAGYSFTSTLFGDESLSRRPMKRVTDPLRQMGARIELREDTFPPIRISGGTLHGIEYRLPVASAQVKSAILMAGLFADGTTTLTGRIESRDHTEKLLPHFGAELSVSPDRISIRRQKLHAAKFVVPGDPSSAAFWLAAACVVPGGHLRIRNLLLNPTRTGFVRALKKMGADFQENISRTEPEAVGEIEARGAPLKGISVAPEEVASLIDELPMLAVLATYAHGVTEVRGAEELRVKETDRIEAVAENLRRMGVAIETFPDGFRLQGPQKLQGANLDSFGDHRIAMAFSIGSLGASGTVTIARADSVAISYPEFYPTLRKLMQG